MTDGDGRDQRDPTTLTTQALLREVSTLREIIEARLDGMDRALERAEKYPTAIDSAIKSVKEFYDEKFEGIELRFHERDLRFSQAEGYSKVAVEAALQAQMDSAAKSEAAFTKQIDSIAVLLMSKTDALGKELGEVKQNQTMSSGKTLGAAALVGYIFGTAGFIAAVITVATILLRAP